MMLRAFLIATVAGVGALLLLSSPAKADGPTLDECVGDVDSDGDTDLTDLGILLAAWNSQPGDPNWDPRADLDGDGYVDTSDLGTVLGHWGAPDDEPGCDGESSDALQFQVVAVDNSSVQPGDDPEAPEFAGGVTHFSFDLLVIVTDGNDWTAAQAEAALTEPALEFFYHRLGDYHTPSRAELVAVYPALEFDTMVMTTRSYPGNSPPNADPDMYIGSFRAQAISVEAWFGIPPNGGDGVATIARYTIVVPDGSATIPSVVPEGGGGGAPILGTLTGVATSYDTQGDCNEFAFDLIVGQCRGDLNGDYDIDQADLGILLADWGCTGGDCPGDCDDDGDTDQSDLGILLAHWGEGCG